MNDEIEKLQRIKQISDLMKTHVETRLRDALAKEREQEDRITALREQVSLEARHTSDLEDAARLQLWMRWSRTSVSKVRSAQARSRALVEIERDALRAQFGRATAVDKLLEAALSERKKARSKI